MNEDYLWNKTGEDREIKNVEEALAVFRHEASAAPALRARVTEAVDRRQRWTIWLRFAFAGSAAAVLAAAVWIWAAQERETPTAKSPEIEGPADARAVSPLGKIAGNQDAQIPLVTDVDPRPTITRTPARGSFGTSATAGRAPRIRRQPTAGRSAPPALTSEEKYAYEQLMLALSITGSKLKIVRDTINGTEDIDRSDNR